jgi:hypothetical protein
MAAPYQLGWPEDRSQITPETSPNEAYRAGWRDCLAHINANRGEIFITDDIGGFMTDIANDFVLEVINAWPQPLKKQTLSHT